jgi:hypothetical protein
MLYTLSQMSGQPGNRARNYVHAAQFADALCSVGSGVDCRLNSGDIAFDQHGDKTTADPLLTDKTNVGRLQHRV